MSKDSLAEMKVLKQEKRQENIMNVFHTNILISIIPECF